MFFNDNRAVWNEEVKPAYSFRTSQQQGQLADNNTKVPGFHQDWELFLVESEPFLGSGHILSDTCLEFVPQIQSTNHNLDLFKISKF
jgi:hypothetical protein